MTYNLKNLFTSRKPQKKDFSSFFKHTSKEEQKKMMEDLAREANQDQRELVRRYQARQEPA